MPVCAPLPLGNAKVMGSSTSEDSAQIPLLGIYYCKAGNSFLYASAVFKAVRGESWALSEVTETESREPPARTFTNTRWGQSDGERHQFQRVSGPEWGGMANYQSLADFKYWAVWALRDLCRCL